MASYPSSVKTFTTRIAGDTIQPGHINDLQDEVNAIEDSLINGLDHVLTVSTFGAHHILAGGTGTNEVNIENTTSGVANAASLRLAAGTSVGILHQLSQGYTTANDLVASGTALLGYGAGGLRLSARHASGVIGFYTNVGTQRAELNASGAWRWHAYGAGTLTTDASGNITAVSDERLKTQIAPFERGSEAIAALRPIRYHFTPESGLDPASEYTGFSAQNVQAAIPEAVGQTPDGYLTLADRPILAAAVNAIQALLARVAALEATVQHLQAAS